MFLFKTVVGLCRMSFINSTSPFGEFAKVQLGGNVVVASHEDKLLSYIMKFGNTVPSADAHIFTAMWSNFDICNVHASISTKWDFGSV